MPQPHDRLFKALMSYPETAGALLREYLPLEIAGLLAPENPELASETFVSQELLPFYSDRVFRAKMISGKALFFYTLIEHKSYLDHRVGLQLGRGIMGIKELEARKNPDWVLLPAVLPLVLYHGAQAWKIPREFLALVDANEALRPYLMNFSYILANLGPIPDQQLARDARLRAGLMALKYGTRDPKTQMESLESVVAALVEAPELVIPVVSYLLTTFADLDRTIVHDIVLRVCPQEEAKMMSIFAREIVDQNKQAWWQEGRQEGRQEGEAAILLKLMHRKFGQTPDWVATKVRSASLELIEIWSENILSANSLEDVFAS